MNNFVKLYLFEVRKIFSRKLTLMALIFISLILIGAGATDYFAIQREPECNDQVIVGRALDDTLFDEMRAGITPEIITDANGNQEIRNVQFDNNAYRKLFDFLLNCCGNKTRTYNVSEMQLSKTFNEVVDYAFEDSKLNSDEIAYWQLRRAGITMPPVYGQSAGYSNSIINLYMANFFMLILIGASLSGVFADEYSSGTDAIILSSKAGKGRLLFSKIAAGLSVGLIEGLIVIAANCVVPMLMYGLTDADTSIQLTYGPALLDMPAKRAFWVCIGIMILISLFYSAFTMFASQLFKNIGAPVVLLFMVLIGSVLNPPNKYRLIAQVASFMPATFPGSWNFTDYRLLNFFGLKLNFLQAMPVVYVLILAVIIMITALSYKKTEVVSK